jgi:hypothetical protein
VCFQQSRTIRRKHGDAISLVQPGNTERCRLPVHSPSKLGVADAPLPVHNSGAFAEREACAFEERQRGELGPVRAPQVLGGINPMRTDREHHLTRADGVHLRIVHAGRCDTLLGQRLCGCKQGPADLDDHDVGGAQVLGGAIVDRPFALGGRRILLDNTGNAGERRF